MRNLPLLFFIFGTGSHLSSIHLFQLITNKRTDATHRDVSDALRDVLLTMVDLYIREELPKIVQQKSVLRKERVKFLDGMARAFLSFPSDLNLFGLRCRDCSVRFSCKAEFEQHIGEQCVRSAQRRPNRRSCVSTVVIAIQLGGSWPDAMFSNRTVSCPF